MPNCPSDIEMAKHLEGTLPEEQRQLIEHHLQSCEKCSKEWRESQLEQQLFEDLISAVKSNHLTNEGNATQSESAFNESLGAQGYRILAELYRGGQGVVYTAIQESNQRKVAIKRLTNQRQIQPDEIARFEREIEAATKLSHPNIVTVFDNGNIQGFPYLVMEFIPGLPLDHHVLQHFRGATGNVLLKTNDVHSILKLFAKVCSAISYAHRLGVIHRDLKPTNILVDHFGEPKVLDFGLAKFVESPLRQLTHSGQFLGTLAYASPEQVQLDSADIDTRSDVYSLGVILFELITSKMPYSVDAGLSNAIQNITGKSPTRPSKLEANLEDDVETIILKSLAKEPALRYQTVEQLERDIELYLAGQPIEAKRDRSLYVLLKTMKRFRGLVAGIAALMISITTALFVSLWFWNQAVEQRNQANAAKANEAIAREDAERQSYVANIVAAKGAIRNNDIGEAKRRLETAPERFRGWEWDHFRTRADGSSATISVHDLYIFDFEILPDGKQVASVAGDNQLKIWNLHDQTVVQTIAFDVPIIDLAKSVDEKTIAANIDGREIQVFDLRTFEVVASLKTKKRLSQIEYLSANEICGLERHFDSKRKDLLLWNWLDDTKKRFELRDSLVKSIAIYPKQRKLAVAGSRCGEFDLEKTAFTPFEFSETATAVRYLTPSHQLGFACENDVVLLDVNETKTITRLSGHDAPINDINQINETTIATSSNDQTVRLWDLSTGQMKTKLCGHTQPVTKVARLSHRKLVTSSNDATFKTWTTDLLNQPRVWTGHEDAVREIKFKNDSGVFASCSEDGKVIIRDLDSWTVKRVLDPQQAVFAIDFSPDGRYLATGGDTNSIIVWDLTTGIESKLTGHSDRVHCVDFSQNGDQLLSCSRDGTIRLWELETRECRKVIPDHGGCVHACLFHPSQNLFASRSHVDIRIWNSVSFDQIRLLKHRISPEDYSLTFDPKGNYLCAGSSIAGFGRGYISVIGIDQMNWSNSLEQHNSPVNAFAFFPDGSRAVSASSESVKIWDMKQYVEMASLDPLAVAPYCLAVSPDGKSVLAGLADGEILVWRAD